VVLYQPQIPPNTGNIARLCVATRSVLHLIHPLGFSTEDSQLKRAGLDYWRHLDVRHHEDWERFLKEKGEGGMFFFSKKAHRPYTHAAYREGDFLVFGSETTGLPEEMRRRYEAELFTIPMWGETRSINLATSVGIVLYEALRQAHGGF
jgi:tRNA (cytidine/uridine-2'-O-)-methyltransferase